MFIWTNRTWWVNHADVVFQPSAQQQETVVLCVHGAGPLHSMARQSAWVVSGQQAAFDPQRWTSGLIERTQVYLAASWNILASVQVALWPWIGCISQFSMEKRQPVLTYHVPHDDSQPGHPHATSWTQRHSECTVRSRRRRKGWSSVDVQDEVDQVEYPSMLSCHQTRSERSWTREE